VNRQLTGAPTTAHHTAHHAARAPLARPPLPVAHDPVKLSVLACVVVSLAACQGADRPRTAFDGRVALAYVKTQLDFGPRIPGSPGAQRCGDWIIAMMRQRADTVMVQSWSYTTAAGVNLPLRNILARFRPTATERVLYVTHWDTRPISDEARDSAERLKPVPGANDGASGTALFIALGDVLKKTPPSVGVDLLFVDGEDYGDFTTMRDVLLGSTYFASHLPSADYRPIFGVLWDMIGDRELEIYQEGNSMQKAPEVVKRVWDEAADLGYGSYFIPQYRYTVTDDHVPLLRAGLRVIDVIDFEYPPHHTPGDTIDKVSAESLQIVGDVATALVQ
jgi:glutaminyl-peptide cyclotransferase